MKIFHYDVFNEERMRLMSLLLPVEFNNHDKKKMRQTFLRFLVDSINECMEPLVTLIMDEKIESAFISGYHYLDKLPIEFTIHGPDKVESLLFMSTIREVNGFNMIDLLINNWYFVTIRFQIDIFPLSMNVYYRCLQNRFGFKTQMRNGYPCEDVSTNDILDVLTFAHCDDMYMSWLRRLITEITDLDKIRFLFNALNHGTMNPDYMELKMMCIRRLGGINNDEQLEL